jgi:hypothetical protein
MGAQQGRTRGVTPDSCHGRTCPGRGHTPFCYCSRGVGNGALRPPQASQFSPRRPRRTTKGHGDEKNDASRPALLDAATALASARRDGYGAAATSNLIARESGSQYRCASPWRSVVLRGLRGKDFLAWPTPDNRDPSPSRRITLDRWPEPHVTHLISDVRAIARQRHWDAARSR